MTHLSLVTGISHVSTVQRDSETIFPTLFRTSAVSLHIDSFVCSFQSFVSYARGEFSFCLALLLCSINKRSMRYDILIVKLSETKQICTRDFN